MFIIEYGAGQGRSELRLAAMKMVRNFNIKNHFRSFIVKKISPHELERLKEMTVRETPQEEVLRRMERIREKLRTV